MRVDIEVNTLSQGAYSPCVYRHKTRRLWYFVHSSDNVGLRAEVDLCGTVSKRVIIKLRGYLGLVAHQKLQMRIPNRVLTWRSSEEGRGERGRPTTRGPLVACLWLGAQEEPGNRSTLGQAHVLGKEPAKDWLWAPLWLSEPGSATGPPDRKRTGRQIRVQILCANVGCYGKHGADASSGEQSPPRRQGLACFFPRVTRTVGQESS